MDTKSNKVATDRNRSKVLLQLRQVSHRDRVTNLLVRCKITTFSPFLFYHPGPSTWEYALVAQACWPSGKSATFRKVS